MDRSDRHNADYFLARPPRAAGLVPFVELLWSCRRNAAHHFERVLPSGRAQLLVNLAEDELREYPESGPRRVGSGAGLQGPSAAPRVIDTAEQARICGVSFRLGGTLPFIDVAPQELVNQTVELDCLWGVDGRLLRERLCETPSPSEQLDVLELILLEKLRGSPSMDPLFVSASRLLVVGKSVHAVRDALNVSATRLIDVFRQHTGLTPKLYSRLQRFQRAIRSVDADCSWAQLAAHHGFSDQAHMIREFQTFAGTTPKRYQRLAPTDRNHLPLPGEGDNFLQYSSD